jgi:hypothetical protein
LAPRKSAEEFQDRAMGGKCPIRESRNDIGGGPGVNGGFLAALREAFSSRECRLDIHEFYGLAASEPL